MYTNRQPQRSCRQKWSLDLAGGRPQPQMLRPSLADRLESCLFKSVFLALGREK